MLVTSLFQGGSSVVRVWFEVETNEREVVAWEPGGCPCLVIEWQQ